MTDKEKAKAYDEAIERAKSLIDFCSDSELKTLEYVFPELKESEDEKMMRVLIGGLKSYIDMYSEWYDGVSTSEIIAWLEKKGKTSPILSNSSNIGKVEQKSAEWSEEDEDAIGMAIIALDDMYDPDEPNNTYAGYSMPFNKAAERLKSLRPQNTWKPSDEQIKVLNEVLNFAVNHESPHWNDYIFGTLNNHIRQLKKLREE